MGSASSAISNVGRGLQQGVQSVIEAPMLAVREVAQAGEKADKWRRSQGGYLGDLLAMNERGLLTAATAGLYDVKRALVDDQQFQARAQAERQEKAAAEGMARLDEARSQNELARTRDQQLSRARGMMSGRRSPTLLTSIGSTPRANKSLIGQ